MPYRHFCLYLYLCLCVALVRRFCWWLVVPLWQLPVMQIWNVAAIMARALSSRPAADGFTLGPPNGPMNGCVCFVFARVWFVDTHKSETNDGTMKVKYVPVAIKSLKCECNLWHTGQLAIALNSATHVQVRRAVIAFDALARPVCLIFLQADG